MKKININEGDLFLYLRVAERLEKMIEKGILKIGDKLISVRALSKEQGISISTAYKAYSELEIKGIIEARPKSGYYVKFTSKEYPLLPHTYDMLPRLSKNVDVDEMISIVYANLSSEGIIKLSLSSPVIELLPAAKLNKVMAEVIRRSPTSCILYENGQGNYILRKQIAKQAFNWKGNISADDIITTQGCLEALLFCLKAVTNPGDVVAIDSPVYFGIFNAIKNLGLRVIEIPTNINNELDIDYLENVMKKVNIGACLFVTNFSNPIGTSLSNESKKRLVELLAKKEIPLIEDDIYGEIYFGKSRPITCKTYDKKGLVLLCSSVSKSLAPGYRVGWCIPGKFKEKVLSLKFGLTVSSATPTQTAVGLFFETGRFDLHMRNLRKALHTQCLRYTQSIIEYFPNGTKVSRPEGGYVLWIELNKKIDAFTLFELAMNHKISIAPGSIFSTDGRFKNFIRISFGSPFTQEIEDSIKTLGKLVRSMLK